MASGVDMQGCGDGIFEDRDRDAGGNRDRRAGANIHSPPTREGDRMGGAAREVAREGARDGEDGLRQLVSVEQEELGGVAGAGGNRHSEGEAAHVSHAVTAQMEAVSGSVGPGGTRSQSVWRLPGAQCRVLQRLGRSVFVLKPLVFVERGNACDSGWISSGPCERCLRAPCMPCRHLPCPLHALPPLTMPCVAASRSSWCRKSRPADAPTMCC